MPSVQPLVEVEHLYKVFGDHPELALELLDQGYDKSAIFERTGLTVGVRDASFTIYAGEVFVIMGLSGSGKSTLLRLLNRLIEPTSGTVRIHGTDVTAMDAAALIALRRREMSMVFQSFALLPHLSVRENAEFGLDIAGEAKAARHERAQAALEQVGLAPYADIYPDELSGGMQQRVGLARALAVDPSLMLMDEAFSALDPLIRREMQDELLRLQRESTRTVVFISHDLDEALRIGHRIAIMEGGRILQVGTPGEILNDPADDYVRSFFRGVDVGHIFRAGDLARKDQVTFRQPRDGTMDKATLIRHLREYGRTHAFILDPEGRYVDAVSLYSLERVAGRAGGLLEEAFLGLGAAKSDTSLAEVLRQLSYTDLPLPVVEGDRRFLGAIASPTLLSTMVRAR
ncbi:quaternary amine ABC transporter ATP-binding protein [Thiohalorhabdus sp. Cl-TMA]|uniref:Quaternary amine transport ATP-binding protein n=1 Tax=Thiohalorhabdus methylotrophus TaxID=3242694 RepID=A0ABV4TPP2_9GAMM